MDWTKQRKPTKLLGKKENIEDYLSHLCFLNVFIYFSIINFQILIVLAIILIAPSASCKEGKHPNRFLKRNSADYEMEFQPENNPGSDFEFQKEEEPQTEDKVFNVIL